MKNRRLIFIIAIIVLILISLVTAYNIIVSKTQRTEVEKYLNYINSEEIGEEVKTPKMMHVVLAAYKGNVKDLSIVKSITYFKTNIIPEIQENTKNHIVYIKKGFEYQQEYNKLQKSPDDKELKVRVEKLGSVTTNG